MKLLHTSDWHLGKVVHEYSLLEEQAHFLRQLLDHLGDASGENSETGSYDALVIAGDLYDRAIPPVEAIELFDSFLVNLRKLRPGLPVIVIPGNHDSSGRLAYGSRLFSSHGVHFFCRKDAIVSPFEFPALKTQLWALPYLYPGDFTGDVTQGHATQVTAAVEAMRGLQRPGWTQVLVAHLFVAGGEVSDSERVLVGNSAQVPRDALRGFDYVALGHLHKHQEAGPGMHYSGSPLCYSFSECGPAKVLLSVTVEAGRPAQVEPVTLPVLRNWARVKAPYSQLSEPLLHPQLNALRGSCLEITLDDGFVVPSAVTVLQSLYPHLLSLRQNPTVSRTNSGSSQVSLEAAEKLGPMDFFNLFCERLRRVDEKAVFEDPMKEIVERAAGELP